MPAGKYDITIEEGATFLLSCTWKDAAGDPIDLTGYSAAMQVRRYKTAADTLLDVSSSGGEITLGDAAGTIEVAIPATETAALTGEVAVYDLELTDGSGVVTRLLEGDVTISREVTR
jgi:hypothetical protein